jgi:erythromycin esterase
MRMADYFCDQPAFDCFDAVVCVTETNGTAYTRPPDLTARRMKR